MQVSYRHLSKTVAPKSGNGSNYTHQTIIPYLMKIGGKAPCRYHLFWKLSRSEDIMEVFFERNVSKSLSWLHFMPTKLSLKF
ncbi:hypothetical protein C6A37_06165 [Desulfobacteraceae bacterium SEEP-SAG9]|nr:hypothetical protein C6A37_06165 [Desulfobacteraceae bacterium SEEP-SAG9]